VSAWSYDATHRRAPLQRASPQRRCSGAGCAASHAHAAGRSVQRFGRAARSLSPPPGCV
jgi:hypothetical protein